MTSAPWSVKGIDPKAREAAKDLARRSGLTLGEWLNQRIREEGGSLLDEANSATDALEQLTDRIEATEQRSTLAVSGIDQSLRGMLARLERSEREQTAVGARFEGALQDATQMQAMLDARLRKLEDEAVGPRSAEALKSLEAALGRVANHLYDGESRTRESLADVRRDMGNLTVRLDTAEQAAGTFGDDVAARLVERLDKVEARMDASVRALQQSFAQLGHRLGDAEARIADGGPAATEIDSRFEAMAAELASGLQAAKVEMSKQLQEAVEGGAERMDQALLDMTAHVQAAERRSAEALERMGHEVLRVADTLSRRVQGVETRAAGAIQQVGGEVARVVDTLEERVGKSASTQAQTLEKLGGEIARVTEKLADRIGVAERRSAMAVDDVSEQVRGIGERLGQRYDRAAGDLAERIRMSEERTSRLLEEARERIDRRLAEAARAAPPAPPPAPAAVEPPAFADPYLGPAYEKPQISAAQAAAAPTLYPDAAPFGQVFAPAGFSAVEPQFDDDDLEAAQDFATSLEAESEADFAEDAFIETAVPDEAELELEAQLGDDEAAAPVLLADEAPIKALLEPASFDHAPPPAAEESFAPRILTTRELIDQARAAARAAAAERDPKKKAKAERPLEARDSALGGIGFGRHRRKSSSNRPAMIATAGGAAVMMGAAAWLMFNPSTADNLLGRLTKSARPSTPAAPSAPAAPRAAVALDPKPIVTTGLPAAAAPPLAPTDAANAAALYNDGLEKIKSKNNAGLDDVRKAANLGYPSAQSKLGWFYENGGAGLTKNSVEARRWYERAATTGDRGAMHNLGMMYFEGEGGPKNATAAAQWFRQAAELGAVDSQYNLGMLYEKGLGVPQNTAEAYKWYLLASREGPQEQRVQARDAANRLKVTLPVDARMTAERIVADVAQRASGQPVQVAAAGVDITGVQQALARLGYYKGAANGVSSAELRVAIQRFQRDQGVSQSGQLDSTTMLRMNPYMR